VRRPNGRSTTAARAPDAASAASSIVASVVHVVAQTSTSTGSAPAMRIAASVAGKVKAGSSTGPRTPLAINGAAMAAVPLEASTHAEWSPPQARASTASSLVASGPKFENRFASYDSARNPAHRSTGGIAGLITGKRMRG